MSSGVNAAHSSDVDLVCGEFQQTQTHHHSTDEESNSIVLLSSMFFSPSSSIYIKLPC